jgi:glycerate 2-kinase
MIIENYNELLSHGNIHGRKLALDIVNEALAMIDAYGLTRKLVSIQENTLKVGSLSYDLSKVNRIYVLGAGKAVLQIAEALDDIFGERIAGGVVIEKRLDGMTVGRQRAGKIKNIRVLEADHPVPDGAAVDGAREILKIAMEAAEGDLVFFCVQGGCTCLTTLPIHPLTLTDIRDTTDLLLQSGASIRSVNSVRSAITTLSRGRLAKHIYPAEIINLVVNDFSWALSPKGEKDPFDLGWGPTVPAAGYMEKEFEEGLSRLREYDLWKKVPESVKNYLRAHDSRVGSLTVKDFETLGIKYHTFILAGPKDVAEAAGKAANGMNIESMILSTCIEGEASQVGSLFGAVAKELSRNGRPLKPPCIIISSGETTVTLQGEYGQGGRNQELVLSAALKIHGGKDIVIASVGTDGTDGPSYIAGGIVDGLTVKRAEAQGISLSEHLKKHNSSFVLSELGDAIRFNQPGNNVCDLSLIVIHD